MVLRPGGLVRLTVTVTQGLWGHGILGLLLSHTAPGVLPETLTFGLSGNASKLGKFSS